MSIARDAVSSAPTVTGTTLFWIHNAGDSATSVAFIGILGGPSSAGNDTLNVIYGGLPCTRLSSYLMASGPAQWLEVWGLLLPPRGVQVVTAAFGSSAPHCACAVTYTGAVQSSVLDVLVTQATGTVTITIPVITVLPNCWIVAFVESNDVNILTGLTELTHQGFLALCDSDGPVAAGETDIGVVSFTPQMAVSCLAFEPADGGAKGLPSFFGTVP